MRVSRLRRGTSWEPIHSYYEDGPTPEESEMFNGVVWLGRHGAGRAEHAVSLVRFEQGGQRCGYITEAQAPSYRP